jgi:predicted nucleic acid-binding Zn ribbon protein
MRNIRRKNGGKKYGAKTPAYARRRVLAQWRGVDLTEQETAQADRAQAAGHMLPQLLESMGMNRRRSEAEIVKVWNHLIDPTLTAHAQPTGINKGTLFVTVDSNVWLSEIVRYRRKEILQQLQTAFSSELIARVSYRVG